MKNALRSSWRRWLSLALLTLVPLAALADDGDYGTEADTLLGGADAGADPGRASGVDGGAPSPSPPRRAPPPASQPRTTPAAPPDAGAPVASPDGGAPGQVTPAAPSPEEVAPAPAKVAGSEASGSTERLEELTVVGTRESRTAGAAHVLRPRDLEQMDYDNPETVTKQVPGVYARGEDGMGLRPNIGIRGTSPDRSKKVTLMEDGILFGPAPYSAPAAYYFPLVNRMEMIRVIKGPGSVSFGPQTVGGAIDLVTRGIPADERGSINVSGGQFGFGKIHGHFGASTARAGFVIEGSHLRSTGFKQMDGGGDTGFERNEWMWKGRYLLSTDPKATQTLTLKLGYSDEDSRETYLGITDADLRANPERRYRASQLDHMIWHRTQIEAGYRARFGDAFTLDVTAYRHDFSRTWRKVNRMGSSTPIAFILADPSSAANTVLYRTLTGEEDWSGPSTTIYVGPNRRIFVSQGVQAVGGWRGASGPVTHRVEAGVRFHYDRIDRLHTEDGFQMQGGLLVPDGKPTLTTADGRAWVQALALHLTDAVSWGPLTLTPGVRVELIDSWVRDRLMGGDEVAGAPQRVVIPGIGAYGALTPSLGLFAGVHRGFSPAAPGQPAAVVPETSINYEAGVRFSRPRLRLEAIGFFNDYRNLTSICTFASGCSADQLDVQYNAGGAHIYGAELFARVDAKLAPGLAMPLVAGYTYTRTELLQAFNSPDPTLGNVNIGDELPFVPRHQGSAIAALETRWGALAIAGSYISAMRERAGQGDADTVRTDASFVLDVTARAKVAASGQLYLNVRNLLDAHDIASRLPFGARPIAPRWIQVGTKWNF